MNVWQLVRVLLVHVLRGRGRRRVYVVLDGELPDELRDHLDRHDWTVVTTHIPHRRYRGDPFVAVITRPRPENGGLRRVREPVPLNGRRRGGRGRQATGPGRRAA